MQLRPFLRHGRGGGGRPTVFGVSPPCVRGCLACSHSPRRGPCPRCDGPLPLVHRCTPPGEHLSTPSPSPPQHLPSLPQDTLPLSPLSFATLDKQVLGLRGVVVEPTRLESTCLVLAHGVDLFYSRLAPAKGFDSLEDDFNYALLVTALVGLGLGAVALHVMVKNSALSQKWK